MRLFLAINLSERARELIENKVTLVQQSIAQDVKWVKPQNWHLTLKFLGDTEDDKISKIKKSMGDIATDHKSFYIQYTGIGAFPHLNYPRVIYIGVNRGSQNLLQIQKEIEENFIDLGFKPEDREFTPHLTIGRGRKSIDHTQLSRDLKEYVEKDYFINVYSPAVEISLMKSELYPAGPVYKEIFSKKLQ
ncbi:MAG: RNA 2',3'-cyclic phosphodiesterase [Halanaerobiales bacterium]